MPHVLSRAWGSIILQTNPQGQFACLPFGAELSAGEKFPCSSGRELAWAQAWSCPATHDMPAPRTLGASLSDFEAWMKVTWELPSWLWPPRLRWSRLLSLRPEPARLGIAEILLGRPSSLRLCDLGNPSAMFSISLYTPGLSMQESGMTTSKHICNTT